jgi:3-deoxy-D-manno-octulosonic-acid transferase
MFIYQLLIRLLLPVVAIYLLLSSKKQWGYISQRFGFGYQNFNLKEPIWIHCASVGEVKSVEQLAKHISQHNNILITTNTITGQELVNSLFDDERIKHQYLPYDLPLFIERFIKQNRPSQLWVVETEIWANLFQTCHKKNIPIKILNGRLSKKTLNAPKWLKNSYKTALFLTSQVITRNQKEADNFHILGVAKQNISIIGNLKYAGLANIQVQKSTINQDFVLLASSHCGEELAIVQLWHKLKRDELLVIVPRHPKRRQNIINELAKYRNNLSVYSLNEPIKATTKIYLIDAIGKIMPLFADAKLVIMGGSFVKKGGHNILEPAAVKSAIITGANMLDFEQETELLKEYKGLEQYQDYAELAQQLPILLADQKALHQLGENAYKAVLSQQHILNDYLKELDQL